MTSTINNTDIDYQGELAKVRHELEQVKQAFEDWKVRASDILGAAADDHDLCETYDRIAEDAGLYPRARDQEIEVEVSYKQMLTVRARNADVAREQIRSLRTSAYWSPNSPFASDDPVEEYGGVYDITVTVPDRLEPPF